MHPDRDPKNVIPKDNKKQRSVVLSMILFLGEMLFAKYFLVNSLK